MVLAAHLKICLIQKKAIEITENLKIWVKLTLSEASIRWLEKCYLCYNIVYKAVCRESGSVSTIL